jgi:PAS domain S-box-containing protein
MSPEQLAAALDHISDAVLCVDRDYRITALNRSAEELTGYRRADVLGKPCSAVMRSPVCGDAQNCLGRRVFSGDGHDCQNCRITIIDRRGRTHAVCMSAHGLADERGAIAIGLHTFRPATNGHDVPDEPLDPNCNPLEESERRTIACVLRRHQFNRTTACRELGLSRTTLWRKMRKLGIDVPHEAAEPANE